MKIRGKRFQFEGEYAHQMLRQYKPKSIFDMSLVTAALRPSGASYRNQLMQHIPNKNPSPIIDELLEDNNGYLCVEENQLINTINGRTPIKDIKVGDVVYTDGGTRQVTKVINNGKKRIWDVKILGSTIKTTSDHRFLTPTGWKPLNAISVGDCVAYRVGCDSTKTYNADMMKILGWLLGAGKITLQNAIQFTNQSLEVSYAFRNAVESYDNALTTSCMKLASKANHDNLYRSRIKYKTSSAKSRSISQFLIDNGLNRLGGDICGSAAKFIPAFVFSLNRACLLNFLGAYSDTDSCRSNTKRVDLSYTTHSIQFADDIKDVIRLLGYSSRIVERESDSRKAYDIRVLNARPLLNDLYDYSIKIRSLYRADDIQIRKDCRGGKIPKRDVRAFLADKDIKFKYIQSELAINLNTAEGYLAASDVLRICEYFDISWDEVQNRNIEWVAVDGCEAGERSNVYDLEIETDHNFVCNGVVLHNCYQEDVIKFLQEICGFSGSEADNTRRAIARKEDERMKAVLPQILEGYCSKSSQPRKTAEEEARAFLKIIEDASSYMFGLSVAPHSSNTMMQTV